MHIEMICSFLLISHNRRSDTADSLDTDHKFERRCSLPFTCFVTMLTIIMLSEAMLGAYIYILKSKMDITQEQIARCKLFYFTML